LPELHGARRRISLESIEKQAIEAAQVVGEMVGAILAGGIANLVNHFSPQRHGGDRQRGYQKAVPDDPWGAAKAEHFRALDLA
jgi:hypothetical protein